MDFAQPLGKSLSECEFFIHERHFTSVAFLPSAANDCQFRYSALLIDQWLVRVASFSQIAMPVVYHISV
jgi:hypothetical protein